MFGKFKSLFVCRTGLWMLGLLSVGSFAGCVTEMGPEDVEETVGEGETVGEVREALTTEVCNGVDDDGDFSIDEGDVCAFQTQVYAAHEYMLVDASLDWAKARAACQGQGFDLVKIDNATENAFVGTYVSSGQGRWIGLNDRGAEGTWRWADGSAPLYFNWSPSEPNNYNDEDCGVLLDTSKWNDLNCGWSNKALCELMNPVLWQNVTGPLSASGTSLVRTQYDWSADAGASSIQSIASGDGFVQFTTFETNKAKVAGLSTVDANPRPNDIDFAIVLDNGGRVWVLEQGNVRGNFGAYDADDVFRVEVLDGVVRYLRNGAVFYISTTAPVYPLVLDTSFSDPGATIGNARLRSCASGDTSCIDPGRWRKSLTNVLARSDALKRVGGTGWLWSAGATARNAIGIAAGSVEFSTAEVNTDKALGLVYSATDFSHASLEHVMPYAFFLASDNHAYVYENGVRMQDCGPYLGNDKFKILVKSGAVYYYRGATKCYTSTKNTTTEPLFVEAALKTLGATITDIDASVSSIYADSPQSGCTTPATCDVPKP